MTRQLSDNLLKRRGDRLREREPESSLAVATLVETRFKTFSNQRVAAGAKEHLVSDCTKRIDFNSAQQSLQLHRHQHHSLMLHHQY